MSRRTLQLTIAAAPAVNWVPDPWYYANVKQTNTFESQETVFAEGLDAPFYDTIESYSTTRRAPTLGPLGSILAFGGGHSNGAWNGIYRFDLATATWSTHQINCGLNQNGKRIYLFDGESGDADYGEFYASADGTSSHLGEPAARHTYNYTLWLPPGSIGSDPLGYFYMPWGGALAGSGNRSSRGAFYAALSNPAGRWTRFGLWASTGRYGHSMYDSLRNRVVAFPAAGSTRTTAIRFHACATGGMTTGTVSDPLDGSGLRNKDGASFYWAARDLFIHIGGDGSLATQCIKLINPTTYAVATVTTNPVFTRPTLGAWEWVEDWQQLIYMDSSSGVNRTRVHRFIPPADPLTQAWTYQTMDLLPATSGLALTIDAGHTSGYGKLQYHASIGAFLTTFQAKASTPPQVLNIPRYQ